MNNIEIRPDCNIIVSRCKAEEFLNNSSPSLENLSARYYEQVLSSSQYTGFVPNTTLSSFYSSYNDYSTQPIAILGGINSDSTHNVNLVDSYVDLNGSYKADETPIKNTTSIEFTGIAIFNGDKMVGELTGMNSICYLMCTSTFTSYVISIPSPFVQNQIIDLSVELKSPTKTSVQLLNGSPYISTDIKLDAYVLSLDGNINLSNFENINLIEQYASSYMENKIEDFLYSTAKKNHSDIVGFGNILEKKYLTINAFKKINWLYLYRDSFFNVNVDVSIPNSYLLIKS